MAEGELKLALRHANASLLLYFQIMKRFVFSACLIVCGFSALGQDALQQKGSWYIGTSDVMHVANIFTSGVQVGPSVGFAVCDDFVVSILGEFGGNLDDLNWNFDARYFFGSTYAVAGIYGTSSPDPRIGVGQFLELGKQAYLSPQLQLAGFMNDSLEPNFQLSVGLGLKLSNN